MKFVFDKRSGQLVPDNMLEKMYPRVKTDLEKQVYRWLENNIGLIVKESYSTRALANNFYAVFPETPKEDRERVRDACAKWFNENKDIVDKFEAAKESLEYPDSEDPTGARERANWHIEKYGSVQERTKYKDAVLHQIEVGYPVDDFFATKTLGISFDKLQAVLQDLLRDGKIREVSKDSYALESAKNGYIPEPARSCALNAAKSGYEFGSSELSEKEFKEVCKDDGVKYSTQLYEYYLDLATNYGPEGFYEEFKEELDFDPSFVAEYGGDDEDEDEEFSADESANLSFHFGEEKAKLYGNRILLVLSGKTVSKRKDLAEAPGGLIYEARKLGIDMWDLLEALEGMCYEGKAREIDDSTYLIGDVDKVAREDCGAAAAGPATAPAGAGVAPAAVDATTIMSPVLGKKGKKGKKKKATESAPVSLVRQGDYIAAAIKKGDLFETESHIPYLAIDDFRNGLEAEYGAVVAVVAIEGRWSRPRELYLDSSAAVNILKRNISPIKLENNYKYVSNENIETQISPQKTSKFSIVGADGVTNANEGVPAMEDGGAKGDCYQQAWRNFYNYLADGKKPLLVHGIVTGRGEIEGKKYNHAWIEVDEQVIDTTMALFERGQPKEVFYSLGGIDNKLVFKYTAQQVFEKATKWGTYGPWEDILWKYE